MSEQEQKAAAPAEEQAAPPHAEEAKAAPMQAEEVAVEMVQRTIIVPKASAELSEALHRLVVVIDQVLKDGWDTGQDLPPILTAVVLDIAPKVAAINALGDAITKKPVGSTRALLNSSLDTVAHFTKE